MKRIIGILTIAGCATQEALQCSQSGGEWVTVSDCPTSCPPPAPTAEACATIEEMACITVCGDVAACHCPDDQPFWQEGVGCVGFEACPEVDEETSAPDRRTDLLECVIDESGCDLILEPDEANEIYLQGAGYYLDDGMDHSGETVCIPAGTYRHLNFSGLQGTEDQPIFITNCGAGRVVVDGDSQSSTLTAHASRHLVLSGSGDPDEVYGVFLQNAGSGNMGIDMQSGASHIEVEYFEVSGPAYGGIAIRTYPYCDETLGRESFTQSSTSIHHNYVHDVGGEGLYIGPSHYHEDTSPTSSAECEPGIPEAALRGVWIHDNLIEDVGRDGIQVGAAIADMEITQNIIRRYALEQVYGHVGGIQVNPGSVGRIHRNLIESDPSVPDNAIQFAGGVDGPTYFYNNLIIGSSTPFVGLGRMGSADAEVLFLNNTTLSRTDSGKTLTLYCIEDDVQPFTFKNNIFADYAFMGSYIYTDSAAQAWTYLVGNEHNSNCPINGVVHENGVDSDQVIEGNLYAQDAGDVGFVDLEGGDYRLAPDSPAVGAGENLSDLFTQDFDGEDRGDGAYDMGAFQD